MRTLILLVLAFICLFPSFGTAEEDGSFKNISVKGKQGNYTINGELTSKLNSFYYTVEDGHEVYVDESKVKVSQNSTFTLSIQIPKEKLPHNATLIIYLYQKQGDSKNAYPVVLDVFK